MNKVEVIKVLGSISHAYDRFDFDEGKIELWSEMMEDQSFDKVMKKLKNHILNEKFPPTIAELITKVSNFDYAVQLQQWVEQGNDPSEFNYKS